jgi:hypothetical protein
MVPVLPVTSLPCTGRRPLRVRGGPSGHRLVWVDDPVQALALAGGDVLVPGPARCGRVSVVGPYSVRTPWVRDEDR